MATTTQTQHFFAALLVSALCVFIPGCDSSTTPDTHAPNAALTAQENDIMAAAKAMQSRGSNASVEVLNEDGDLLIKLASDGQAIKASVPLQGLTDSQLATAREIFADAGATGDQLPRRNTTDLFPSLSVSLGNDPEQAARFAADLLEQAYAIAPQAALEFETEED